jgi:phage FluMu protein Com
MIKDFRCPECNKYGLHFYDSKGFRPKLTDSIRQIWCLHCNYNIPYARKTKKP